MNYTLFNIVDSCNNITGRQYCVYTDRDNPKSERFIVEAKDHSKASHWDAIITCLKWIELHGYDLHKDTIHLRLSPSVEDTRTMCEQLFPEHAVK